MKKNNLFELYLQDTYIKSIHHAIENSKVLHIGGLIGSIDSLLIATYFKSSKHTQLVVLDDKEDAAYFFNDLQQLIGEDDVYFFPISYKKPYQYEEVENANVLMRSEVLSKLNEEKAIIVVTYPEAIAEKVVNRQTLLANTLAVRVSDTLDINFISELLISYEFDKSDFVFEPGQFAIRGGIIDIFSYATDHPVRIELFGDEVDSIRFFDPENQLSISTTDLVHIIPDVQNKLINEKRESIINYFRNKTTSWIKNVEYCFNQIDNSYIRIEENYKQLLLKSGGVGIVFKPDELMITSSDFTDSLTKFSIIEFGKKSYFKEKEKIEYITKPQPSFNKEFNLLVDDMLDNLSKGYSTFICSDSLKQLNRLEQIFNELNPTLSYQPVEVSLREGFVDTQLKVCCYTDHQIFEKYHRFKVKDKFSKSKALTIKELNSLQPGDYITHIDYGIGRFAGMESIETNGKRQEVIRIVYRDNDLLYINIHALHKIAKYTGKEGVPPTMSKLGTGDWEARKSKVKKQVKEIAEELIKLYAKRRESKGFAFSVDSYLQAELESSFIYEDTPDQAKASTQVKEDMEKPYPMDRLVCGDVGFGKTEVAIRAAFKAVNDSKQVAILVPTTILASQHFKTFSERFKKFPVNVDYINRFKSSKEISETLKKLKEGKIDILIGTHSILGGSVVFQNLGLLIIDEEQKFGVKAKEKIKEIKLNVDVLTLTATPIPRTLHFSLMGARDLSVIATPPPNRYPVSTEIAEFREEVIRDAISYELQRGGQVFFVHNRVNDIESIANLILRLVPDAKIGVAHGQMEGNKLEKAMMKFIDGDTDILVSTNIIEAGLDIPNANTIIINQAHMFGLSDLHQMRGRVGRSNKKAFCYLLTQPLSLLTKDARKRLKTLEEFSDLGDGFKVAMRDLDIRGAGNLLGSEQSGFINDLGYDVYHKILDDAVKELKETEFKGLFETELSLHEEVGASDCQIETDLDILIPESYISSISERLFIYNEVDNIKDEETLNSFRNSMVDRFGKLPIEVENLFEIVRIRWMAESLGFEKLTIKDNIIKGYFVSSQQTAYYQSEKFGKIIDFVRLNPKKVQLKQLKEKLQLIFTDISSLKIAKTIISEIFNHSKS